MPAQKTKALIAISAGTVALCLIGLGLYLNRDMGVAGIPAFLPQETTVAMVEFPVAADRRVISRVEAFMKISWEEDILPWAGGRAALVFIDKKNPTPILFVEIGDRSKLTALSQRSTDVMGYLAYARQEKNIAALLKSEKKLGRDRDFIFLHEKKSAEAYGIYLASAEFSSLLGLKAEEMFDPLYKAAGIYADIAEDGSIVGKSYGLHPELMATPKGRPYSARLLPFLPADFSLFLGGINFSKQLKMIDITRPELLSYFGGAKINLNGEFAILKWHDSILFAAEVYEKNRASIEELRAAFVHNARDLAPEKRTVTLPDQSLAEEFVPASKGLTVRRELFHGVTISAIDLTPANIDPLTIYDSYQNGIWMVSQDKTALQKALLLQFEPGRNLRESDEYKTLLQGIMKNPDLVGMGGGIGFSKTIESKFTETAFRISDWN